MDFSFLTRSETTTEPFSGSGVLMITGGPSAGKTTQLLGQLNAVNEPKILLKSSDPLSRWTDDPGFQAWCGAQPAGEKKDLECKLCLPAGKACTPVTTYS